MKIFIQEYGRVIITSVVVAIMLLFLTVSSDRQVGLLSALNNAISTTYDVDASSDSYSCETALNTYSKEKVPVIKVSKTILVNQKYKIKDLIKKDPSSTTDIKSLHVTKCCKLDDSNNSVDVTNSIVKDDTITFPEEGIYYLSVYVEGSNNTDCTREIRIGVSRR